MAIKFVCACGKHLRAREELAGKRSICPKCGQLVGVPFLQPTHRGAPLGPITHKELLRTRWSVPLLRALPQDEVLTPTPLEPEPKIESKDADRPVDVVPPRPPHAGFWAGLVRRTRGLGYPVRALPLILGHAMLLTWATGLALVLPPHVIAQFEHQPTGLAVVSGLFGMIGLVVLGFPFALLEGALTAATGETRRVIWAGPGVATALLTGFRWLVCFLAGPAVVVAGIAVYWVYCGDPGFLDWVILSELTLLAAGYFLLALVAAGERGRLRDANPLRVGELAQQLGSRSWLVALGTAGLVLLHGTAMLAAGNDLQHSQGVGWVLLFVCWTSGLFWGVFWIGLVGRWCQAAARPVRTDKQDKIPSPFRPT